MRLATIALVAAPLVGAACASYPERVEPALAAFQAGEFDRAIERFQEKVQSDFLRGAETGTVALAGGRWNEARRRFETAAAAARDVEERALLGPDELAESIASWVINDRARAYPGEGFERVYLHVSLAWTYLAEGLLDDVYVEVRRANELLEAEERLYEAEYGAGGLGHLISAIVYELLGEPDQAYVDYQRMATKGVGLSLAGPSLVRIARSLGRAEEASGWEERFGAPPDVSAEAARVILLAAVGLGPYKVEASLTVPVAGGVYRLAVPEFRRRPQPVQALRLVERDSGIAARSEVVENVSEVARRNLADRIGWVTGKSAIRGAAKLALTKKLEDEYGAGGWLAGTLFTLFSERADLRSWTTLPDTWQAARLYVPPGVHDLDLELLGGPSIPLGRFQLDPGETMFVFVRVLGNRAWPHVVGGLPVDSSP